MSKLASIKIHGRMTPEKAIRKISKQVWSDEFKIKYRETVCYFVKPSDKKRKMKKRAEYANISRKRK